MTILEDFEQIQSELEQIKAAIDVRRRLSRLYAEIVQLDDQVEYYKANTGFDDIPADTKAALNRFYQLTLTCKTAFEADTDFAVIIRRTGPEL